MIDYNLNRLQWNVGGVDEITISEALKELRSSRALRAKSETDSLLAFQLCFECIEEYKNNAHRDGNTRSADIKKLLSRRKGPPWALEEPSGWIRVGTQRSLQDYLNDIRKVSCHISTTWYQQIEVLRDKLRRVHNVDWVFTAIENFSRLLRVYIDFLNMRQHVKPKSFL